MANPWSKTLPRAGSNPRAGTPIGLWAATNLLNLADALLTQAAISNGLAREANPLVTAIGLPAKVVGVACASAFVAMLKPRALWIPIAALAVVATYTLLNLAFP